jgi:hypothetical protein
MASAPVAPKKAGWLKKLGQVLVKIVTVGGMLEKSAEPVVEAAFPLSVPVFAVADKIIAIIQTAEAAGQAASAPGLTGAQKLQAALPLAQQALAEYAGDLFPGYKYVPSAAVTTSWVNAFVQFLNEVDPQQSVSTIGATSATMAAAVVKATLQQVK